MIQLCQLGSLPHERYGFVVRDRRVPLTVYQALFLDVSVLRASRRYRAEAMDRAQRDDHSAGGGGVNTIISGIRSLVGVERVR